MRIARVLLASLGLLAGATTASAECAWVLWGQTPDPNPSRGLLVAVTLGAWNSRGECEQERVKHEQSAPTARSAFWVCLPDTVDPRAPKGK